MQTIPNSNADSEKQKFASLREVLLKAMDPESAFSVIDRSVEIRVAQQKNSSQSEAHGRFERAKEYFFQKCKFTLGEDQREIFQKLSVGLLKDSDSGLPIVINDSWGIELARRSGNSELLAQLVAIAMVSLNVSFKTFVANALKREQFLKRLFQHFDVFLGSDEFYVNYDIQLPTPKLVVKGKTNQSTLEFVLTENEPTLSPLEKKFNSIKTSISPEFRDIACVLLGFVHSRDTPFVVKEVHSELMINLANGLILVITPGLEKNSYSVCFKSFVTQSFEYPTQIGEIVCALDRFFGSNHVSEKK